MTEAKKTDTGAAKAGRPLVVEPEHEYTSGLKNFQESERSYSEALQTISGAINKGVDSYLDERDRSAAEKKDGALEDFFINSAKGVSVAAEAGSSAIYDIAKSIDAYFIPDRTRKDIKRSIRSLSRFRFPIIPIPFVVGYNDDDDEEDDD